MRCAQPAFAAGTSASWACAKKGGADFRQAAGSGTEVGARQAGDFVALPQHADRDGRGKTSTFVSLLPIDLISSVIDGLT